MDAQTIASLVDAPVLLAWAIMLSKQLGDFRKDLRELHVGLMRLLAHNLAETRRIYATSPDADTTDEILRRAQDIYDR